MPPPRAFAFTYHRIISGLDEEKRDEVDAILGDPAAKARRDERRVDSVETMGFEVG